MDSDSIKAGLKEKGFSLSLLADAMGRSPSMVSKVVRREAKSAVVAEAISKALGKPIKEVFPDVPEYDKPLVPRGRSKIDYQKSVERLRKIING